MPNWNSSGLTISAPLNEVNKYLVYDKEKQHAEFNMHKLFPETFDKNDATGKKGWNYDCGLVITLDQSGFHILR